MSRTADYGLVLVGAIALLGAVAYVLFVNLDGPGLAGAGAGVGLGLVNLGVGSRLTARALRQGMRSAMGLVLGGMIVRLVVLCGLVLLFHFVEGVDEVAFALSFMVLFFVYVGVEVLLVERTLQRR